MRNHIAIPDSDLRDGDLMRLGGSTNYVLVADAQTVNGQISVTIYNGTVPNENGPTLTYDRSETVHLSMRDAPA